MAQNVRIPSKSINLNSLNQKLSEVKFQKISKSYRKTKEKQESSGLI